MSKEFNGKDKYGSYNVKIVGNVLFADLTGSHGMDLSKQYGLHVSELIKDLSGHPWAFYGNYVDCEGYTPEALEVFKKTYKQGLKNNCVIDCYRVNSAMLIDQVDKIRRHSGLKSDINTIVFETEEECLNLIKHFFEHKIHKFN